MTQACWKGIGLRRVDSSKPFLFGESTMAIKGVQIKSPELITMPITNMFLSLDKTMRVPILYIQHKTSCAVDAKVSYKRMPVITSNPDSLFCRLAAACGVKVAGLKQRDAAKKIAAVIASKGAIKAKRVGKEHDWHSISLVNYESDLLEWHLPTRPGIDFTSLFVIDPDAVTPAANDGAWDVGDI